MRRAALMKAASQARPHGGAQAFGEADTHTISPSARPSPGCCRIVTPQHCSRVGQARAVHVNRHTRLARGGCNSQQVVHRQHAAATPVVGLLDADKGGRRKVGVVRDV